MNTATDACDHDLLAQLPVSAEQQLLARQHESGRQQPYDQRHADQAGARLRQAEIPALRCHQQNGDGGDCRRGQPVEMAWELPGPGGHHRIDDHCAIDPARPRQEGQARA